jgi:hypothetical protein
MIQELTEMTVLIKLFMTERLMNNSFPSNYTPKNEPYIDKTNTEISY